MSSHVGRLREEMSREFRAQLLTAWDASRKNADELGDRREQLSVIRTSLKAQANHLVNAITNGAGTTFVFERLKFLEGEVKALDQLLAVKRMEPQSCPSKEEMEKYLERKTGDIAAILLGDPVLAKREMQDRIKPLTITPVETPQGLVFKVEGSIGLFAGTESVLLDTTLRYPVPSGELGASTCSLLSLGTGGIQEERLENCIVSGLVDFDDQNLPYPYPQF